MLPFLLCRMSEPDASAYLVGLLVFRSYEYVVLLLLMSMAFESGLQKTLLALTLLSGMYLMRFWMSLR